MDGASPREIGDGMRFGAEIALTPGLSGAEKKYIEIFGAPVLGMRVRARAILPLLDEIATPTAIADAGSGRGVMTMAAARKFSNARVVGLDLNEKQNEVNKQIAKQVGIPNVEFRSWDVMKLDELGTFDAILSSDNLEHIEDDMSCAKVFYRALNPGGYLIVHVPHLTRNLFGWHRQNWLDIEGHVRAGYTREGLTDLLTRAGFQVVKCFYNYNSVETLANDLSYAITGGHERNKGLYAVCFPFLMGLANVGSIYKPQNDGTGLVALARRMP